MFIENGEDINTYTGLLLGVNGQLGRAISAYINDCTKMVFHPVTSDLYSINSDVLLHELIIKFSPQVIINAAAYTSVEKAEKEPENAMAVNCNGVGHLAQLAKQYDALLVHFSTDYVFDGSGLHPWSEKAQPSPVNIYGQSKWQGEQAIIASGCRYLIIRTSWLHSPWRHNFVKTMLQLGQTQSKLSVVCDQVGAPTSAIMLAEVTLQAIEQALINPALCGLYHVAAAGETSWYDYARFIFAEAKALRNELKLGELKPVQSYAYPVAVSRPLNSRLDTAKFRGTFDINLPDWRDGVRETLWHIIK